MILSLYICSKSLKQLSRPVYSYEIVQIWKQVGLINSITSFHVDMIIYCLTSRFRWYYLDAILIAQAETADIRSLKNSSGHTFWWARIKHYICVFDVCGSSRNTYDSKRVDWLSNGEPGSESYVNVTWRTPFRRVGITGGGSSGWSLRVGPSYQDIVHRRAGITPAYYLRYT
jgi:hypothetical protein